MEYYSTGSIRFKTLMGHIIFNDDFELISDYSKTFNNLSKINA